MNILKDIMEAIKDFFGGIMEFLSTIGSKNEYVEYSNFEKALEKNEKIDNYKLLMDAWKNVDAKAEEYGVNKKEDEKVKGVRRKRNNSIVTEYRFENNVKLPREQSKSRSYDDNERAG